MDPDLIFVIGLVLGVFSIPAILSSQRIDSRIASGDDPTFAWCIPGTTTRRTALPLRGSP